MSLITPSEVIGDTTDQSGSRSTKVHPNYKIIQSFPGQAEACPVCGAWATDAPEGQFGLDRKLDSIHNTGDPVWENVHCFKCGYRNSQDGIAKEAELFSQFKSWLSGQTEEDLRRFQSPSPVNHQAIEATTRPVSAFSKEELEAALANLQTPADGTEAS